MARFADLSIAVLLGGLGTSGDFPARGGPVERLSSMAETNTIKTVLVVDDSLLMRRMISEIVTSCGWKVVGEAANGQEAVDAYFRLRPAVVTLDIVMPGMDGLNALQQIVSRDPKARVIVVSALSQTKLISEAIRKGAYDFVAKPFLPEQLRETVERCYEGSLSSC